MTAINALSEMFELTSQRYGEHAKIKFNSGVIENPEPIIEKVNKKLHGTTGMFKPSEFYLSKGKTPPTIPVDKLTEWLRLISYTVPNDIHIELQIIPITGNVIVKDFDEFAGLSKFLQNELKAKYLLKNSVLVNGVTKLQEEYRGEVYDRTLAMELAFNYDTNDKRVEDVGSLPTTYGFCNFIYNDLGGTHIDAAIDELVHFLGKITRDALSEKDAKKLKITKPDILTDLDLVINVLTDANPEFPAQTKGSVGSELIIPHIRQIIRENLQKMMDSDPKTMKKITDKIKTTAKSRAAANKERVAVIKKKRSVIDEHRMKKYNPANNKAKNAYRELFLIEGDSAAGSVNNYKFNDFQASFSLRGKPLNVIDSKMEKILTNEEISQLIQIIGAGFGKGFKLEESHFEKIVFLTDADPDGKAIKSLLAVLFLWYFRPLVEAGKVYAACPPLYKLKGTSLKNPYIEQKSDYSKIFYKEVAKNIKLISVENGVAMPDVALVQFMDLNKRYLTKLEKLAKFYSSHMDIMEFIAIHIDDKDFSEKLTARFPEMTYSDGLVTGVYEGQFQSINFINIKKRIAAINDMAHNANQGVFLFNMAVKDGGEYKPVSDKPMYIGEILRFCEKYKPGIEKRFKGLGEMRGDVLRDTTLDPKTRLLIQLTCDDLEEEVKRFEVLHGSKKEMKALRKELVAAFDIDIDELDS